MTRPRAKTPIEKAPVADGDLDARKRPLDHEDLLPAAKPGAPFDGPDEVAEDEDDEGEGEEVEEEPTHKSKKH